jgi:signal transduction histidine kinase/CheY-like chemotaxis protein
MAMITRGEQHLSIRYRENGTVIEVRGHAMPDGGYVNTYVDISEQYHAESALRQSEKDLIEANESLEKRVTERTESLSQVNIELQQAKAEADSSHQSKTRFLAAASHDLMQPLNAAKLFSTALAQRQSDLQEDAQSLQLSKHLDASLANAEQLISDLIEISKLDGGSSDPHKKHFCAASLMQQLAAEFNVLCQQKELTFHLQCSQATLFSDPNMLRRVLQNFLTNAVRYTEKGKVLLGCRRLEHGLEIQVWDTGFGIPENKLDEIFVEFKRLESGPHAQKNGIGLGLAIAQRTARALSHPIRVVSNYDRGSMFSIQVPWGDSALIPSHAVSNDLPTDQYQLKGFRVLVIDNELSIQQGMHSMLSLWGCKVYCAATAAQGLELIDELRLETLPQLILADYHLDQNYLGTDAIAQIKQAITLKLGQDTPAIVITADRSFEMKAIVKASGFGLIHKPLKPAVLRKLINRLI